MRNDRGNVDLGTFEFATGKRVNYIVRAESRKGKVRFAGVSGGPPVERREDAHRFTSKTEAEGAAQKIRSVIPPSCTVTVEEA